MRYAETLFVLAISTGVFLIFSKILLSERDATKTIPKNPKRIEETTGTTFTKKLIVFGKSPYVNIATVIIATDTGMIRRFTQSEV